jgi:hypothetical protein
MADPNRYVHYNLLDRLSSDEAKTIARDLNQRLNHIGAEIGEEWLMGFMLTIIAGGGTVVASMLIFGPNQVASVTEMVSTWVEVVCGVLLYLLMVSLWKLLNKRGRDKRHSELRQKLQDPKVMTVVDEMRGLDDKFKAELNKELAQFLPKEHSS